MLLLVLYILCLLSHSSESTMVVVDGVSEWTNPSVHIGDSVVFQPKHQYDLYIFRNQNAFNLCNFNEATILTQPNASTYTWYPSRLGTYYFIFRNGSSDTCNQDSQKLPIKVLPVASPPMLAPVNSPPEGSPIPSPIPGGVVPSSPAYPWPFHPHEKPTSPAPLPSPANSPIEGPDRNDGMPFINSNPVVPLPTGEVDSTTIRPLPANGRERQVVVSFCLQARMAVLSTLLLLFMV